MIVFWLLRDAGGRFSYWIRPYDMSLDARRWRWQRRGCWRASDAGRRWQATLQRHLGDLER